MFDAIAIPYGAVMLFNVVRPRADVDFIDIELALGEMCNTVKDVYGNDTGGFIAGQVFRFSGQVSDQGSLAKHSAMSDHVAIVTYWKSFDQHEHSHADAAFLSKFAALAALCEDSEELAYTMLWQGATQR